MKKKAIFFTISIFFIILILIGLVSIASYKNDHSDYLLTQKYHDLISSLYDTINDIITEDSGIDIILYSKEISFYEVLPNDNVLSRLSTLQDFAKEYDEEIEIYDWENKSFVILPYDARYYHEDGIKVSNIKNLKKIDVKINILNYNISDTSLEYEEGDLSVSFEIKDSSGNSYSNTINTKSFNMTIDLKEGDNIIITLDKNIHVDNKENNIISNLTLSFEENVGVMPIGIFKIKNKEATFLG